MSSIQETKSSLGSSPNENIAALLDFQDKFLTLVHSQLYSQREPLDDALVKFQINEITDANNAWRGMVEELTFTLVKQRAQYDTSLRDLFHKTLNLDYLPLLRINRHEVTQLSLYGFDIYVDPLSAILEIINRIDGLKGILNQAPDPADSVDFKSSPDDVWESLKMGWLEYMLESALYKIAFNLYILKEYLKIGAKSLVKRDKEIVFTGCGNLFTDLIPSLKRLKQLWLLIDLSELTNELYNFHPSFNYSQFYVLMLPLRKEYEPVFRSIKYIGAKCLNTNILTPLLFAILRHSEGFTRFINEAEDECWVDYLNGLALGLVLNFKARILEYEQAMNLLKLTITKLGVIGQLDPTFLSGELGPEWAQARDFFISALKVGYNVGELQTWHPIDPNLIQPQILEYTINALFMLPELPNPKTLALYLQTDKEHDAGAVMIGQCLQRLSGGRLSYSQFTETGFNRHIVEQVLANVTDSAEAAADNKTLVHVHSAREELLRLANLIEYCGLIGNPYALSYTLTLFSALADCPHFELMQKRLAGAGYKCCRWATARLTQHNNDELKDTLYNYCSKYKPEGLTNELIQLSLSASAPRQAMHQIFLLLDSYPLQEFPKWMAANIVGLYCSEKLENPITLKTFQKEYKIDAQVVSLKSRAHSLVSFLIERVIWDRSEFALNVLTEICRINPWATISLLSFPVSFTYDKNGDGSKLESFSLWFIKNPQHHALLIQFMRLGLQTKDQAVTSYCSQISNPSVCEQIINQVNRVVKEQEETEDKEQYSYIIELLMLLLEGIECLGERDSKTEQLLKRMLQLYIKAVGKLDESCFLHERGIGLVVESLIQFYPACIEALFTKPLSGHEWRLYMKKICLISLNLNSDTSLSLHKEITLPSIKKDNSFLIQNSIDYFKDEEIQLPLSPQTIHRIQTLSEHQYAPVVVPLRSYNPTSPADIVDFKLDETTDMYLAKEFLPPCIGLDSLLKLTNAAGDKKLLLTDLLAMNPTNHHRLSIIALDNNDIELLISLGLSKQIAVSQLGRVLSSLDVPQMERYVEGLDEQSRKSISDSFTIDHLTQNSPTNSENPQMNSLVEDFNQSLGFLLVFNQSNWRYLMEWSCQVGDRVSSNIPSIILQYLEYHRITANSSSDYEDKIATYQKRLSILTKLIEKKHAYLKSLKVVQQSRIEMRLKSNVTTPQGSMVGGSVLSGVSSVTPKIRRNVDSITEEEIMLFQTNELGNIKMLCEAWSLKEVLSRAANFQKELGIGQNVSPKYQPIHDLFKSILADAITLNQIANSMAGGPIVPPNFAHHFRFCSKAALYDHKIGLGEHIEEYFDQIGIEGCPVYEPTRESSLAVEDFINHYVNSLEVPPQNIAVKNSVKSKQAVRKAYNKLKQELLDEKVIGLEQVSGAISPAFLSEFLEEEGPEKDGPDQTLSEKQKYRMYYFGCLQACLNQWDEGSKLAPLFSRCSQRHKIPWELLKPSWPEIYHYIKATLIDDQIASRKMTFTFKNKPLIPDGETMNVNNVNRLRYCNLVGEACLHPKALESAALLAEGYSLV